MDEQEKKKIITSFSSFILDNTQQNAYSSLISAFIVVNENEQGFKDKLNRIREGVIIYTGLQFTDVANIGSWNDPLTILVDTEILFHFAGYNGTVYKKLWNDLYKLIKKINERKPDTVKIVYCSEVDQEINNFFSQAEAIIRKNKKSWSSTAMSSILQGCSSPADIVQKKAKFLSDLKNAGITEDNENNYYHKRNWKSNINFDSLTEKFAIDTSDVNNGLSILNKANIRNQKDKGRDSNVSCIFITGKMKIIQAASDITSDGRWPLATSLYFITNLFWFKLGKGFGGEVITAFDIVVKAQILIASKLDNSVNDGFNKLQKRYENGELARDEVIKSIAYYKKHQNKPENISKQNIDDSLDFIKSNDIEHHLKQSQQDKIDTKKAKDENIKLRKELLNNKKTSLDKMKKTQQRVNEEINKKIRYLKVGLTLLIILSIVFLAICIYLGTLTLSLIAGLFTIIGGLIKLAHYFLIKEKCYWLAFIYKSIENRMINNEKIEKKHNFNVHKLEEIEQKIMEGEEALNELKTSQS